MLVLHTYDCLYFFFFFFLRGTFERTLSSVCKVAMFESNLIYKISLCGTMKGFLFDLP